MRILITGVNGFVGKHLYIDLIKVHEVIGIYNSGNKVFENCFKVDLTNKIEIDDFFKNFGNESIDETGTKIDELGLYFCSWAHPTAVNISVCTICLIFGSLLV